MDARRYNPITAVSAGQFTTEQRQRLEAYTAAVLLHSKDTEPYVLLDVAVFITTGEH